MADAQQSAPSCTLTLEQHLTVARALGGARGALETFFALAPQAVRAEGVQSILAEIENASDLLREALDG